MAISQFAAAGPASVIVDTATNVVVTVVHADMRGRVMLTGMAVVYVDAAIVHAGPGDVPQSDGTYMTPVTVSSVTVPTQITTRQFVIEAQATTLPGAASTLWDTIKGLFAQQPGLADVFWASAVIMRDDAMFAAAAAQLGIPSATQDAFFLTASTL